MDTWKSDSYGLYDYESTNCHATKRQYIRGPCKLFRNWTTSESALVSLEDAQKGRLPHEDFEFLFSIIKRNTRRGASQDHNNSGYSVTAPELGPADDTREGEKGEVNTCYLSVKTLKQNDGTPGYCLAAGDVVKLGRLSFLVIEICTNQKTEIFKNLATKDLAQKSKDLLLVGSSVNGSCRICLGDEMSETNLMISACKCSGSCALVHVECLKIWIDSKIKKESKGAATVYNFSKFECELCKSPYPITIQSNSRNIDLMTIDKPMRSYIMLESIPDRKFNRANNRGNPPEQEGGEVKHAKSLYVIAPDDNKGVKLGRGHQSDIVLDDISVSRVHSEIAFKNNNFYLRDLDSKFGTLVEFRETREITDNLKVQCGRTVYTFRFNPRIRTCQYLP